MSFNSPPFSKVRIRRRPEERAGRRRMRRLRERRLHHFDGACPNARSRMAAGCCARRYRAQSSSLFIHCRAPLTSAPPTRRERGRLSPIAPCATAGGHWVLDLDVKAYFDSIDCIARQPNWKPRSTPISRPVMPIPNRSDGPNLPTTSSHQSSVSAAKQSALTKQLHRNFKIRTLVPIRQPPRGSPIGA